MFAIELESLPPVKIRRTFSLENLMIWKRSYPVSTRLSSKIAGVTVRHIRNYVYCHLCHKGFYSDKAMLEHYQKSHDLDFGHNGLLPRTRIETEGRNKSNLISKDTTFKSSCRLFYLALFC
jgi:hypothetical protein